MQSENILNQDRLVRLIEDALEFFGVAGLVGRPGAGKSHTSRKIAEHWSASGGLVVYVLGDENQRNRRYFPFQCAISNFGMSGSIAARGAVGATAKGLGVIPYAGPLASFAWDLIFNSKKDQLVERYSYLSKEEQSILFHLQRISTTQRLLLICDDIQDWDEASLPFLKLLLSGRLSEAYPFLKNTTFLLIKTIKTTPIDGDDELFTSLEREVPVHFLEYVTEADFPRVLAMFDSAPVLPADQYATMFGICGGHLHLAKELSKYLCSIKADIGKFETEGGRPLVMKMVRERLRPLGQHGQDLLTLLTIASTIGSVFMDSELACLSNRSISETRALLHRALEMQLIRRVSNTSNFAHGILHDCLKSLEDINSSDLHRQFAICLRSLRPGDYHMRSHHLLTAGENSDAAVYAICAILQERRDLDRSPPSIQYLELIREQGLDHSFNMLVSATEFLAKYELDEAISCADRLGPTAPPMLRAEASYISAVCLIKKYSYAARGIAIGRIDHALKLIPDELEIVVRLLSTQLVALANQRTIEAAFVTQEEIVQILRKRISFDPDALDALRILDRKADLLYAADQSISWLLQAKEHFKPIEDGQPRNFFQYCAACMNVAANRISCGEYDEALVHLREITLFLKSNPGLVFPRPEVLMNNLIVSELLGGVCDAMAASQLFKPLVDRHIATLDHVFLVSNYGASLALGGDLVTAEIILAHAYGEISIDDDIDHLHLYLTGANLASVRFLSGNKAGAAEIFDTLTDVLEQVYPAHTAYFKQRHLILGQVIAEGDNLSPEQWHEIALSREPDGPGPSWRHYGKGFLFTDIQMWTES